MNAKPLLCKQNTKFTKRVLFFKKNYNQGYETEK